jgi:uncharacterized membrane protein (UPF0136 family)
MEWNKFIHSYSNFSNCLAHMFVGQYITIIIFLQIHSIYSLLSGLIAGIIFEIYQYYFRDNKELKIEDRLADISQWMIGSLFAYIYYIDLYV